MLRLLLQANYETILLQIGIRDRGLFGLDYKIFSRLLLRLWIKRLWEFIDKYKINRLSNEIDLKLKRVEDMYLIEEFARYRFKK